MDSLLHDLHYGVRTLRRNRGFAFAALLTIALGIGANTAIFSVVNGVLLRPLPYDDPERIAILWLNNVPEGIEEDITSFPNFSDWRERGTSFSHMAAIAATNRNLTGGGDDPELLRAAMVSADFFGVMGTPALLGRTLLADDNEPGNERVAVLANGLWTRRFGGDPGIIGGTVELNGQPFTVVGVMPEGFAFPRDVELWLPLAPVGGLAQTMQQRGSLWLQVVGRLRDDASFGRAQAEMSSVAAALAEEYPQQQGYGVTLEPLHEDMVGDVRPALLVLFGAVAFVLLIACANVANLLLARGAARQREISLRLALGAERSRVTRQLLTESIVLSVAGGLLGLLLAWWGVGLLAGAAPSDLPRLDAIRIDGIVIAFALAASILTGLIFGAAPALQASRTALSATLREGGRGATGAALLDRMRPVLVAAEVALALVLLAGAGLLVRSFAALQGVDPGFEIEDRLSFRITLPGARYGGEGETVRFFATLAERLEATPGVESVAALSTLFLSRLPNMAAITVEGQPPPGPDDARISVTMDAALGDVPGTLGMRVVAGRWFTASDDARVAPVAVVNETFVRTFLQGEDAVGRRFVFGQPGDDPQWFTIVGIVEDTRRSGLAEPVRPEALFHHPQFAGNTLQFVVEARNEPLALVPAVRLAVRDLDADLPIAQVSTLEASMGDAVATRRFVMQLLALFSAVAATLAAIGIYGVMAYLVSQRTRELGVRMALGAHRGAVLGLVMRDAAKYVVPGLALGAAATLALSRLLQSQLFGVSPTDPVTLLAVGALFAIIAFVASGVPAYRAARVDPMEALRYE